MANQGRHPYEFGPFSLDRDERVLLRDGQPVPLRPKDFDMLLVLVENHGRVVEKDELMKRVWPETFVEEANLSHHVFTLRKVLGEENDEIRYIETIPRRGYRFGAPVTGLADHPVDPTTEEAPPLPVVANGPPVSHDTPPDPPSRLRRSRKAWAPAAVAVAAVAAGYGVWRLIPTPSRSITRLAITLAQGDTFTTDGPSTALALSPQGTQVVYAANRRLYLRPLDRLEATAIPGVERPGLASARGPFFSPDGQWIGFWEQRQLKKVSIHGGAPVGLCDLGPPPYGATWAADNAILIGHGSRGVWRVPADGGTCKPIITLEKGQRVHGPQLLPDGRSVLFTLAQGANWDEAQIVVQSLDTGARQSLIRGADARYVSTGHIVYVLRDTVQAVPFDAASLRVTGAPVVLVGGVRRYRGVFGNAAQFAVSSNGTLAYLESRDVAPARRTLLWVDRQGREEALPTEPRAYVYPRVSPDGSRLALDIQDDNRDIWVWDFSRRMLTRVTTDPTSDFEPVWTSNGQRLIFLSGRTGMGNLFAQSADGSGTAEQLTEGSRIRGADTVTPDGKAIVLRESDGEGTFDLTLLELDGRHAQPASSGSRPLVQSPHAESNAEVSPDGRWLAYQSTRSGSQEVYLAPFPNTDDREWQVSRGGGSEPLWARDGRELFYRGATGAVMRVSISPASRTPPGTPTKLFEASSYALGGRGEFDRLVCRTYDVSPDGRRFLMIKNAEAPATLPPPDRIVLVQNWFEDLKARRPQD